MFDVYTQDAYDAVIKTVPHSPARKRAYERYKSQLTNTGASALFSRLVKGNNALDASRVILASRVQGRKPNGKGGSFGGLSELINRAAKNGRIMTREAFEALSQAEQRNLIDGFSKDSAIDDVVLDETGLPNYLPAAHAVRRTVLRETREETGHMDFVLREKALIPCMQAAPDWGYFMNYKHNPAMPLGVDGLPLFKPTVVDAYCYVYEANEQEFAQFQQLRIDEADGEMAKAEAVSLREALKAYGNPAAEDNRVGAPNAPRDANRDFCYPHEFVTVLGALARVMDGDTQKFGDALIEVQKERLRAGDEGLSLRDLMAEIGRHVGWNEGDGFKALAEGLNNATGKKTFDLANLQALNDKLDKTWVITRPFRIRNLLPDFGF